MKIRIISTLLTLCILCGMLAPAAFAVEFNTVFEDCSEEAPLVENEDSHAELLNNGQSDYRKWSQSDSRWGSIKIGSSGKTVSAIGCTVTAVTKLIIQAGLRDASSFNVATLVNWLNNNGGFTSGGGLYWAKPSICVSGFTNCGTLMGGGEELEYFSSSGNDSKLLNWINQGYHLLIEVESGGHWVAVDEGKSLSEGTIYIMDSLSSSPNADITLASRYSQFNCVHAYKGGTTPTNIAPTATLEVARHNYNPNDTVTFTFGGINNGVYTLGIYKGTERIDTVTVQGATYQARFSDVGMYSAYMTAYNDSGLADSNWVDWQVNDLTVELSVNAEKYDKNSPVVFTIGGNNCLTYSDGPCTLGLFKDGQRLDTVTLYDETYTRIFTEAGDYSAYVTAYSELDLVDSSWVYWKVVEYPSAPELYCPDHLYDVNNYLTFTWDVCSNADYYDFWVYEGDAAVYSALYLQDVFHQFKLPEGTYTAKVASVNEKYGTWTWSNAYEFTVSDQYPERPVLRVDKTEVYEGETVCLSWDDCANADDYDFYVYDANGNTVFTDFYCKKLLQTVDLPTGFYSAKVASVNRNNGTWLWSNEVSFTVQEHTCIYTSVITAPTCTERGYTTYTCSVCGHSFIDSFTDPLDHDYVDGSCIRCGAENPDEEYSGTCGANLEWLLNAQGVMTISGSGPMVNYEYKSEMPWYSYRDRITSVVIENGVTSIGSFAFYDMDIETIEIPETVTIIGDFAFKNAAKLDGVALPSGLTRLGESAFYACSSLTAIEIPAKLYTVQPYTFKNCTNLAVVTFSEGNLQKISDGAFYNTALTEVILPDCLDILDVYTFKNCDDLSYIKLSSSLTEIREAALYGTALTNVEIPEGVTKIGPYAFKNCVNLVSMDLPSTLTGIGEASFYACTALRSLDLPDAVTKIGNYAFRKCAALAEVSFSAGLVDIGESSFYGCEG